MKKTILLVILPQYSDWESAYLASAVHMLDGENYEVKTVGLTKEPVLSIGGFKTIPDYDIQTMPTEYEALILIGALSWRTEEAKQIKSLVEKCAKEGKVLGGICDAAGFLATTGLLNNVKHTANHLKDIQCWAGEHYTGEEQYYMIQAISDQKIITANGTAPLEFAREVMLTLKIATDQKVIEWYNFHKLGFYVAPIPGMFD